MTKFAPNLNRMSTSKTFLLLNYIVISFYQRMKHLLIISRKSCNLLLKFEDIFEKKAFLKKITDVSKTVLDNFCFVFVMLL